jgi:LmeA-like phospholipid-binding
MTRTVTRSMRRPSRGGRRTRRYLLVVAIIIALLVVLDFASRAVAENIMATQIQKQGLPKKPDVSIGGFPFLTQVATKNFQQVTISTTNLPEGPVTISKVDVTASGIRLRSYSSASGTITSLSGTALISFASLGNTLEQQVGPLGSLLGGAGLNLTAAGPSEVKASLNLLVTSGSATWRVTRLSGNQLHIGLISSSGLPTSLLGSIQSITVQIPKLPLGLTIDSVSVTPNGVVGSVSGRDVSFGS